MRKWNIDKKHRCPQCHAVWTHDRSDRFKPRWWMTYRCPKCKTKFAGWGREQ